MLVLLGTIIVLPIYLRNVLGLNTPQTGLLLLPGGWRMGLLGLLSAGCTTQRRRQAQGSRRHHRHRRAVGHDAAGTPSRVVFILVGQW